MVKKSSIYWYCQILGWAFYIVVNSIFLGLNAKPGFKEYLIYFLMLPAGIGISHVYRLFIKRLNILQNKIPVQLLVVLFFSFVMGLMLFLTVLVLSKLLGLWLLEVRVVDVVEMVLNFSVIFCLWNVIYFGFHYFQNYKRSEINALRYLATSREFELNNLKAQLNPHFIFNCMNSIRALIDENPDKAKTAVTQLSNILRNTLLIDKNKQIPLKDEMNLVRDYLNLEHIRYEERLSSELTVSENTLNCLVPPFIIQTQVENAIKHGISKQPGTGVIKVETEKTETELHIRVSNSGVLNNQEPLTGIGFKNSIQRLQLLYGSKSTIHIEEKAGLVNVEINIPLNRNNHKV